MLNGLRSRLTYANVVATVAVFLALGGGAYALTGIPDRSGVYHGCVSNATGVLRVVKSASSCQKPKTVRRHGKKVRLPGEFAVAWNQKGQPGTNGSNGINGINGTNGKDGSPAASMLMGNVNPQIPASSPSGFVGMAPSGQNGPSNGPDISQRSPNATIVARDLSVEVETAPPANAALTFTLMIGSNQITATATALSCTIPSGMKTCDSGAATATIPPGTDLVIRALSSGTASTSATYVRYGWRATLQ